MGNSSFTPKTLQQLLQIKTKNTDPELYEKYKQCHQQLEKEAAVPGFKRTLCGFKCCDGDIYRIQKIFISEGFITDISNEDGCLLSCEEMACLSVTLPELKK